MNLAEAKLKLIKLVIEIDDPKFLEILYLNLKALSGSEKGKDFWDELSEKEKAFIEKSRKEHRAGKGTPHEDVIKELKKQIEK